MLLPACILSRTSIAAFRNMSYKLVHIVMFCEPPNRNYDCGVRSAQMGGRACTGRPLGSSLGHCVADAMQGPKRLRVDEDTLRRLVSAVGTNQSTLQNVLSMLNGQNHNRREFREQFAADFNRVEHRHEFPLTNGGTWTLQFCHPQKLTQHLLDIDGDLADTFAAAANRSRRDSII